MALLESFVEVINLAVGRYILGTVGYAVRKIFHFIVPRRSEGKDEKALGKVIDLDDFKSRIVGFLSISVVAVLFLSLRSSQKPSYVQSDYEYSTLVTNDSVLRASFKEFTNDLQLDSVEKKSNPEKTDDDTPVYEEFMGDKLKPIREKIRKNEKEGWTTIDKRKLEYKGLTGAIEYYFFKEDLLIIKTKRWNDSKDSLVDTRIYLEGNQPFFAYETSFDSLEYKKEPKYYDQYEDSIFFEKGEVIRIKASMDCGAPFAESYRKEVGTEVYALLDYCMKRYNREIE